MKIAGISRKQRKLIIYDEHQYYDGKDYYDTMIRRLKNVLICSLKKPTHYVLYH